MATKTKTKHDFDLDQVVSDKLIDSMENGRAPWQSPYLLRGLPLSMSTTKPYRGVNPWLLTIVAEERGYSSPWWGTYDQIAKQGGQVTKKPEDFDGDWSTLVTFWKRYERQAKDDQGQVIIGSDGKPEMKRSALLRYFKVFNAEQAEWPNGLPTKFEPIERGEDFDPIDEADSIVLAYTSNGGPKIQHLDQNMAWYAPASDIVNVPSPENIRGTDEYYSALFHELGHSTGHAERLNRDGIVKVVKHRRGTLYAFEELIAEFSAAMLCAHSGIADTVDNSAAYLRSWAQYLRDDPKAAVKAATKAQAAVDHILNTTFENKDEATDANAEATH
jgi:antirestriction protein ArdC